jgi:hypothetical protein
MDWMDEVLEEHRKRAERAAAEEARIDELSKTDPGIWCRHYGHQVVELEVPPVRICRECGEWCPISGIEFDQGLVG